MCVKHTMSTEADYLKCDAENDNRLLILNLESSNNDEDASSEEN